MISEQQLQSLVSFQSEDPLVLSLYLNVDSTQRAKDEYRLSLRHLLKQADGLAAGKDIEAVEHFFDFEYDGASRGMIIFSCQDKGLWEVFPLAVPVKDRIVVARRPFVAPLQALLDDYGRYGVILVDKEGARLFLFDVGELQEVSGTLGDELKRHRQGGWAAQRLQRRADAIAFQNFKEAAEVARHFCDSRGCQRLVLAGTADNVASFRNLLPKAMQERVVGEMALDMSASEVEVRDKTLEIIREHEREEEQALVERMVTSAAKGAGGVIGLADTLLALQEDRAHLLVVQEGYEDEGVRCTNCGYLGAQPLGDCPYCGATLEPHDHIVDAAVRLAIERGLTVEMVDGNEQLEKAGHIGALLRY